MTNTNIKIQLMISPTGCSLRQKRTAKGLGFTKLNQIRSVIDNPPTRGMINKISHMVKIVDNVK